ncbi:ribose-5-phosphate isomerase RpiA [Streptomyces sp. NPDC050560]|uniref:ribose-5-phosphate isomerase RpiA n=1 Tax=Streptomyces sp. NPDC050560 TaxID=3365630 RepID=UPI0037A03213
MTLPEGAVRAVVFDLDGTLVDSAPDIAAALNEALTARGLGPLSVEQTRGLLGGGAATLVEGALHLTGGPAGLADTVLADYGDAYARTPVAATTVHADAHEALRELREAGVRTAVCTNKRSDLADRVLEGTGLAALFDIVVGIDDAPAAKPDPAHLRTVLDLLGVSARQTLYVGDTRVDALTAERLGVPYRHVAWGSPVPGATTVGGFAEVAEAALTSGLLAEAGRRSPAPPAARGGQRRTGSHTLPPTTLTSYQADPSHRSTDPPHRSTDPPHHPADPPHHPADPPHHPTDPPHHPPTGARTMHPTTDQDRAKWAAGKAAIDVYVHNGMKLGLGSGTTSHWFVRALGEAVSGGLDVVGVPTSTGTRDLAVQVGVPLTTLAEVDRLDLTVDGADEIDHQGAMIKGGGACLLWERIIADASARMVAVVDDTKLVRTLGAFPLPIEVVPYAWESTRRSVARLLARHGHPDVELPRRTEGGGPVVTDSGNFLLDAPLGAIKDPLALDAELNWIPGVVENGLFTGVADEMVIGSASGEYEIRNVSGAPSARPTVTNRGVAR